MVVVDWEGRGALGLALAAVLICYCYAQKGYYQVVHRVVGNKAEGAAEQDMYTDMAGRRESRVSGRE